MIARPRDVGVQLIVAYKLTKAIAQTALAVALVALAATGELEHLRDLAMTVRHHAASRWSLLLARGVAAVFSAHGVHLLEIGLAADAVLSSVEGWSLWRGYAWGPWLVVLASGLPLPLELEQILRHPSVARICIAIANAAVVAYLARRLRRRRSATDPGGRRRGTPGTGGPPPRSACRSPARS